MPRVIRRNGITVGRRLQPRFGGELRSRIRRLREQPQGREQESSRAVAEVA